MDWAYYLTFGLIAVYFLALFLKSRIDRKRAIKPSCDCSGRGRMLVAAYRAAKKKEERKKNQQSQSLSTE